ncbi:MAG: hypothetical protein QF530_13145 [SAR202 cluster bacterium]|nr:hypothetical protein [SAR202 cluster bacterium]
MLINGGINHEGGVKGWQPKITPDQKKALMLVMIHNAWKTSIGKAFVKDEFGIEVSDKGFYNWKQEIKVLYKARDLNPENPVDWNDFQSLADLSNIPIDATKLRTELFCVWERIQKHLLNKTPPVTNVPGPSYRRVKCWAYMFEYYSDTIPDIGDLLHIGDMYMTREMLSEWSQEKLDTETIDKWLLLKPWRDGESMEKYLRLIKDGSIPPLNEHILRRTVIDVPTTDGYFIEPTTSPLTQQFRDFSVGKFDDHGLQNGTMVDDVFDYKGAWRFLLPSQRYTKEKMQKWLSSLISVGLG